MFLKRARAKRPDPPAALLNLPRLVLRDDFECTDLPFSAFHWRSSATTWTRIHDLRLGPSPFGGRQWTFEHTMKIGRATGTSTCALVEVPDRWPDLGIERSDNDTYLGLPNRPEVAFPDDRDFAERYVVRSTNAPFATALVGPDVRRWLVERPGLHFLEVRVGLLVVMFQLQLRDDMLPRLLTWTHQVLGRTPADQWPGGERHLDPGL